MSRTSPTVSVARWSALHPWRAIGLWLAFVAAAVVLSSTVATQQVSQADFRVGESGRAQAMIETAGFRNVTVTNLSGGVAAIHFGWAI